MANPIATARLRDAEDAQRYVAIVRSTKTASPAPGSRHRAEVVDLGSESLVTDLCIRDARACRFAECRVRRRSIEPIVPVSGGGPEARVPLVRRSVPVVCCCAQASSQSRIPFGIAPRRGDEPSRKRDDPILSEDIAMIWADAR